MQNQFMKKSIIALCASVSIAAMPFAADMPNLAVLDYVPADTAMFSGSLEAFPIKRYLEANKDMMAAVATPETFDGMIDDTKSQQVFFGEIVKNYYENISSPENFLANYGLGDETRVLFYTVGFNPVIKFEATDPTAIVKLFDAAAAKANVATEEKQENGVTFKSYHPNNQKADSADLIIASSGDWVTITLRHPNSANSHLNVALGIDKPATSLNDTSILSDIIAKYGFLSDQLTYIDHRIIIDKLTSSEPLEYVSAKDWSEMKDIQTPACRAEFAQIAKSWPRIVGGNIAVNFTDTEYSATSKMIIESTNADTNAALMDLRGFIPSHARGLEDKIFSMAFGVNANKMTGALTKLWSGVTQAKYECEPLIEMQQGLAEANPAALGMFTGMAQGIMGISATIYAADLDTSGPQPTFKMLDALISLASDNPAQQLATAAMMLPPLGGVQLPEDGTPVELNQVLPPVNMIGGKTFAAAVGQHINVYQGGKAAEVSAAMTDEGIEANGFMTMYMHYGEYIKFIGQVMQMSGESIPKELKALEDLDMRVGLEIDFTENGVELLAEMKM